MDSDQDKQHACGVTTILGGVLDTLPMATMLMDAQGAIELLNTSAEQLFGYSRQELRGQRVDTVLPDVSAAHSRMIAVDNGVAARWQWTDGRRTRGRCKDGRMVPLGMKLQPLQTGKGTATLAAIVALDEQPPATEWAPHSLMSIACCSTGCTTLP